jgi:hypothetical protein
VKFISVNFSVDSLENITFKKLPKLLQKDSLTDDTLTNPTKWMVKLSKKLTRKQRQDSNIYMFFWDQFKKLWRNDKSIIFVVFKLPGLCHQITNILTV